MAQGAYVAAGGIKTVSECYVGAGGVKTVSAIYVGQGGNVRLVWPSYTVGEDIFEISTDYWDGYHRTYSDSSSSWTDWSAASISAYSSYLRLTWGSLRLTGGAYFVTKDTVNAAALDYLGVHFNVSDTISSSLSSPTFTFYASIGSSPSTPVADDTGVGTSSCLSSGYSRYVLLDLRSCTRTGYLKIGTVITSTSSGVYSYNGRADLYNAIVGTTTSASDYGFSSFQDTVVIS